MLCELLSPVTEATEGGLKVLGGLMVKCSCLEFVDHLAMLNWLYDLACWHLGFWNSQDVFHGIGCCGLVCGTYVEVVLVLLESVGCCG